MFKSNSIWQFFASVKLALVTIFFIAVTSIIGTVIPQKQSMTWYAKQFGDETARFFEVLQITDMYTSWWFLSFLLLLCLNLIICSIDRFPLVLKQIKSDGLSFKEERLKKMALQSSWIIAEKRKDTPEILRENLASNGWKSSERSTNDKTLLFSQKGGWTRTGVYLVHVSILIIFLGAAIGYFLGFKGSVSIPETLERDSAVLYKNRQIQELGFTVRCNFFSIEFYPNGMPKEYTSSLTIIEDGQEILTKEIEVNKPLKYKGITFYQSSYEPYQEFVITLENNSTQNQKTFIVPFQKQTDWSEENINFGIINAKSSGQSIVSSKIWFKAGDTAPVTQWVDNGNAVIFKTDNNEYRIFAKQLYATGLQVAKDPGVWWVYFGFGLMLFGLYTAFFMSHRRIWLLITDTDEGHQVTCFGSSNKNQPGFEHIFEMLTAKLQN